MEIKKFNSFRLVWDWLVRILATGVLFGLSILPITGVLLISEGLIDVLIPAKYLIAIISIVAIGLSVVILRKYKVLEFNLRWINKENILLIIVSYGIIFLNSKVLTHLGMSSTGNGESLTQVMGNIDIVSFVISTVIAGPILEEFVYRGAGMGIIFGKNSILGVLVVALLFCLSHGPSDVLSFINYFVPALIFCFSYYKSKRLEVSITLHLLNNLVSVCMILLGFG